MKTDEEKARALREALEEAIGSPLDEGRLERWFEAHENQTAGGLTLRSKRDPLTGRKLWWVE